MAGHEEPKENDLKLELVQVIFRHGARTPIREELNLYKFNDTSAYKQWGTGELTDIGKKMEYDFGVFLKERYKNFLSQNYEPTELYAYTTYTDRTKMSLQLVLAGLYPPVGREIWNPNLMWSPIPYTHGTVTMDILFLYWWSPRCREIRRQVFQSDEFRKRTRVFSEFLDFLTKETGVEFDDDFCNTYLLYGIVVADESLNLPLPDWYKPEMKEKFRQLTSCLFDAFTFTLELTKLSVGSLIKTLIDNMNLERAHHNPRKLYLYSAHDANVALLTKSHDIDFIFPEFGCALILEKLRDSNDRIYVRLLYWSGSGSLTPLKLGNHKEFCPIDEYLKIVEPIIPTESEIDEMVEDVISIENLKDVFFKDRVVKKLYNKL